MGYFILAFIVALLVAIVIDIVSEEKGKNCSKWIFGLGMFGGMMLNSGLNYKEPTAIDVYRNKTTLEITYKDGIAIDSTVVFKDKEK